MNFQVEDQIPRYPFVIAPESPSLGQTQKVNNEE